MMGIRPAGDDEIAAIVDLINHVDPPEERVTLEEFLFTESLRKPEESFSRLVAIDEEGIAAVSTCGNSTLLPMNRFRLTIRVDRRPSPQWDRHPAGGSAAGLRPGARGERTHRLSRRKRRGLTGVPGAPGVPGGLPPL